VGSSRSHPKTSKRQGNNGLKSGFGIGNNQISVLGCIMKKQLVAYLRNQGPICYEMQILNIEYRSSLELITQQLLGSGLLWYWRSSRSYESADAYKDLNLPEERPLTQLTPGSASSLVEDFSELDIDGQGRFIAIFGLDQNSVSRGLDTLGLQSALNNFLQREQGPIRVVVIRIGDMRPQYIFVPHYPIEAVGELLENWGITSTKVEKERPYKKLNEAKLESVIEAIQTEENRKEDE
jgi:hypothetical protein